MEEAPVPFVGRQPVQLIFARNDRPLRELGEKEHRLHFVVLLFTRGVEVLNHLPDVAQQSNWAAKLFADFSRNRIFVRFARLASAAGQPELRTGSQDGGNLAVLADDDRITGSPLSIGVLRRAAAKCQRARQCSLPVTSEILSTCRDQCR